jgi:uncharacterized sulfatase
MAFHKFLVPWCVVVTFLWVNLAFNVRAAQPNVVMVLIDDMGWGDFSCFGNKEVKTEGIDRLAKEGIRFTQFYVNSPICSPSRTALTTGQYPQHWRMNSYLDNRAANERRGVAQWLDPKAPTLARHLKQAGYATGHFGKWHMGGQRDVGEAPAITEYGFDESLCNFEGLGPRLLPLCDAYDGQPLRKHALGSDNLGRGPMIWMDRSKITSGFAGAAIEFMKKSALDKKPFYVNVWPDDVHSPFFPPAARKGDGSKHAIYSGVLKTMDEQLEPLFSFIRTNEPLRTNTLVLVCSDNGPEPGAGSAGPFRGAKATLYEGGTRSPLIVWGPGLIVGGEPGTRNDRSVFSSVDLVPSILSIAGIKPKQGLFDGEDLSSVLLGKDEKTRKAPLCWRRPPDRPGGAGENLPDLAIREGAWKLLCEYDGSRPQLYDLAKDPGEGTDLAAQKPEVVQRLSAAVVKWYRSAPPAPEQRRKKNGTGE